MQEKVGRHHIHTYTHIHHTLYSVIHSVQLFHGFSINYPFYNTFVLLRPLVGETHSEEASRSRVEGRIRVELVLHVGVVLHRPLRKRKNRKEGDTNIITINSERKTFFPTVLNFPVVSPNRT